MAPLLFSLRRWRPGHLLMAWGAYWVGLVAATLGQAVPAVLRATGADDNQGSVSASFGEGLRLIVAEQGATTWSLTASVSEAALWVIVPPLVLWAAWLVSRRRARGEVLGAPGKFAELPFARANDIRGDRSAREHVDRPDDSASSR